jgi:hypothetical protein
MVIRFAFSWARVIVNFFEGELLDSDGLENSREAEEESKLCSVLNKSVLNEQQCQCRYRFQHY